MGERRAAANEPLPERAAIDTGVFMRGVLGDQPAHPDFKACKDFCDRMIGEGRQLFIAAPTIAEVARFGGGIVPIFAGIEVVPFDQVAALKLGLEMPMAKIHEAKSSSGLSKTYLKYDAMILACALRSRAEVMVALDSDHFEMARAINFPVQHPQAYEPSQQNMPWAPPLKKGK